MTKYKASFMLVIFALIVVAFIPNNVAMSSSIEAYWNINVGNIPMPKTLKDSLQPGSNDGIVKLSPNYKPNFMNDDMHFTNTHPPSYEQWLARWGAIVKKSELPQDGRVFYFTYDTLSRVGSKLKLHFQKNDNEAKFLPPYVTKYMPTTFNKLQVILDLLSVNSKSLLAKDIEMTIKTCEEKGIKDEKKYCAMSIEDMVDYVKSILNSRKTKLMAVSTKQDNGVVMEYTIQKVHKLGSDDNRNIVCHKLSNPYAVFLCHDIKSTNIYDVTLVDANKKQTKAVAVCHMDTSSFNPGNYVFEAINSKPGGKPICHFVGTNAIVWFQN